MSALNRRGFLVGVGAAMIVPPSVATVAVARSALSSAPQTAATAAHTQAVPTPALLGTPPTAVPELLPPPPPITRLALPGTDGLCVRALSSYSLQF